MPRRRKKKPKPEPEPEKASSKESPSPSVYLVVGHGVTSPAYSVIKVNPFAADAGGHCGTPTPIPLHLARLEAKHCMSFVPVRSIHGPWIVGVGGNRAPDYAPETVVFDTKTGAVIPGPKPLSTKLYPVLLPLGDKIYALASTPAVIGDVNFVPWFEVLDLSQAHVGEDGRLLGCQWEDLPRPPFFPWDLDPREYISPPEFTIKSHVAVSGSYILVSITEEMCMQKTSITEEQITGTHMFDVAKKQWVKPDDKDLPFICGAIPHGPLLFLGLSSATRRITAYKITVCSSAPSLSILEFPISTGCDDAKGEEEELLSTRRFVSLSKPADNPGFCSFRCCSNDPPAASIPELMWKDHTRELVTMTTYTTESQDCCVESTRSLVVSNQWKQVYLVSDPLRRLTSPCLENIISF